MNIIKDSKLNKLVKEKKNDLTNSDEISQPPVLIAILTTNIEINDIFEEEPLP